ncbi:hypothetical protein QN239_19270 [Mycolicibacterium sp. Y3]
MDTTRVETSYGHVVRVYESTGPIGVCWLGILKDSDKIAAQLTLEQAIAVRDKLSAFIEAAPQHEFKPTDLYPYAGGG